MFYPKDNTPGCQQQLSAARDAASEYARRNTQPVAINPGTLESHQEWADHEGFDFPLCVDENKQVAEAYSSRRAASSERSTSSAMRGASSGATRACRKPLRFCRRLIC
jgi:peroxiredoxin